MYNWIKGDAISASGEIENGTPQGSVISPLLFIIMINDDYRIHESVGKSLFADDGALWFKGKNI